METQTKEKSVLPKGEKESNKTKGRGCQEGELVWKPKPEAESRYSPVITGLTYRNLSETKNPIWF